MRERLVLHHPTKFVGCLDDAVNLTLEYDAITDVKSKLVLGVPGLTVLVVLWNELEFTRRPVVEVVRHDEASILDSLEHLLLLSIEHLHLGDTLDHIVENGHGVALLRAFLNHAVNNLTEEEWPLRRLALQVLDVLVLIFLLASTPRIDLALSDTRRLAHAAACAFCHFSSGTPLPHGPILTSPFMGTRRRIPNVLNSLGFLIISSQRLYTLGTASLRSSTRQASCTVPTGRNTSGENSSHSWSNTM